MVRFIPFFVLSEHCVQDSQQLAYTGNQRHFFGFSCGKQSHVKHLYYRVKAGCDKRCHVQGCSHTSPAAKDGSSPSHRARVRFTGTIPTSALISRLERLPCSGTSASSAAAVMVPTPLILLSRLASSLKWLWIWLFMSASSRASSSSSALMMILMLFLFYG